MAKHEVTDEMARRFCSSLREEGFAIPFAGVKKGIDAALNPPAESAFELVDRCTIEITDAMVERAAIAAFGKLDRATRFETATPRLTIRVALEAALRPPSEPEVVVTEEMSQAGLWALHHEDEMPNPVKWTHPQRHAEMANAYRAMYAARPKGCEHKWHLANTPSTEGDELVSHYACDKCPATKTSRSPSIWPLFADAMRRTTVAGRGSTSHSRATDVVNFWHRRKGDVP